MRNFRSVLPKRSALTPQGEFTEADLSISRNQIDTISFECIIVRHAVNNVITSRGTCGARAKCCRPLLNHIYISRTRSSSFFF